MTFEQVTEGMRFSQVSGPDCTATKYENGGWSMDDGDGGEWFMDRNNFHVWTLRHLPPNDETPAR